MKRIIIVLVGLFALSSCGNNDVEKGVEGSWAIDTLIYKNENYNFCMLQNIIAFDKQGLSIPRLMEDCETGLKIIANARNSFVIMKNRDKLSEFPYLIEMKTKNLMFNGGHSIVFHNNEVDKLLEMEIFSKDFYLLCKKLDFSYQRNENLIKRLESKTWIKSPNL